MLDVRILSTDYLWKYSVLKESPIFWGSPFLIADIGRAMLRPYVSP